MDFPRLVHQERSSDRDRFSGSCEQFGAGHQKIGTGKRGQFLRRKGVRDGTNPRPVHLADTHRTGLAAGIENAAADLIERETAYRLGDQIALSVGRRITIGADRVRGRQNNLTVDGEQRAKRMIACGSGFARQFDRLSREVFVDIHRNRHRLRL
jgi:hypothetical protein